MIESLTLPLYGFDLPAVVKECRKFYRTWSVDDPLAFFIVGLLHSERL
jgi:hypothetical protein